HNALAEVTFPTLGRVVRPPEPEARDRAKATREKCKNAAAKLKKQFSLPSEKMLDDLRAAAPAMVRLLKLTLRFSDAYAAEKNRRDLVDYADLEHMAARLLTTEDGAPSALARTISERFHEILVDEYQDVSEVQDLIFRAVSRDEKNLFLVGDVKQSIYRFRLADPGLFLAKYDAFAPAEQARGDESRRILLQENFRSRGAVLDACNHVFRSIMSRALGERDYDDDAALKCGLPEMEGGEKAELCLVQLPDPAEGPGLEKHALEAAFVAERMVELNHQGVAWGDMVILLRSANSVGPIYREALTARGIPVQSEQGGGFFESLEISMVRSLLAVIDNPHQDVPLVAALTSPLFGFDADALAAVRESDRAHDFYTALLKRAETDNTAKAAVETIARYRRLAPDSALTALLWQIYDDRDLMALCSAMPDGDQRRANLHRLLALSESFERTGHQGLHRFTQWLDQQAEQGREPGAAAPAQQSVKIMSIHRSKGLEFPVVFLCDLNRQFNKSDATAAVLVHPKLGLGPKRYDLARGISYPTFARSAIAQRLNRETLSEEMRLLYVAMTRAKDRLILTGTTADAEGLRQKLALDNAAPIPPEVLQTAVSPLYWLLQAALLPGGEEVFSIRIVEPGTEAEAAQRAAALTEPQDADPAALEALEAALTFADPHAAASALPSKVTATELKHAGISDPETDGAALLGARRRTFRMPDFREEDKPLTATERGTATHRVLQYLRFTDAGSEDAVRAQIASLVRAGYLSERDARAVKVDSVRSLMRSPLGARLYAAEQAGTVRREFRFSLLFRANRLFGGEVTDEVLLQGVVDCWWEEDDGVVILDYKTDRIPKDAVPERTAYYASQLRAYGEAMARITGKPVKERLLFFLHNGEISAVEESL
ncbi:MAG: UvrD-helicase domain-containing protein, partial [Oscillospiraceae bacterium]|nr:UvrD-helicase domain-containing protein [Oscillospiraceae bacterium]